MTDWRWLPCSFDLKREFKKKIEYFNLGTQASFFSKGQEIKTELNINMDKSLHYVEEKGWVWHKSWNLPFIKVSVEFLNPLTQEFYDTPKNLYVEVLAVKPFLENLRTFHLIDVGLIGNNRLKITENDCLFSSLKFLTTSYNHKEAKFHLTISLVQKDPEGPPVYLKSVISPPIFVDSRKSARNPMDLKKRHLKPFVEKFPMESLRRPYMKKEKKNLQIIENHIENSLKGLYDYLTAPNIRDKVKNPLFLAMKFPACVRLFYDSEKIHGEKPENVMDEFFIILRRFFMKKTSTFKQSLFLLSIQFQEFAQDHFYIKKILEFYEVFKGSPLEVVSELDSIPDHFKALDFKNLEEFEVVYQRTQDFSQNEKNEEAMGSESESEKNEESSNSVECSEKPSKKVKSEKKNEKIVEFQIRNEIEVFPQKKNEVDLIEFFELKERSECDEELMNQSKEEENMEAKMKIEVKNEVTQEKIDEIKEKQEFLANFTDSQRNMNNLLNAHALPLNPNLAYDLNKDSYNINNYAKNFNNYYMGNGNNTNGLMNGLYNNMNVIGNNGFPTNFNNFNDLNNINPMNNIINNHNLSNFNKLRNFNNFNNINNFNNFNLFKNFNNNFNADFNLFNNFNNSDNQKFNNLNPVNSFTKNYNANNLNGINNLFGRMMNNESQINAETQRFNLFNNNTSSDQIMKTMFFQKD